MATEVFRHHEISLFGEYYPIINEVQPRNAAQFAEKSVTGDFSKESDPILSSWVISDSRGGIGVKDMDEKTQANRLFFSTAHISTKGHHTLPQLVQDATNPGAAELRVAIEYDNSLLAVFGNKLYRRIAGSTTWSASLGTLVGAPTDALVHKNKVYFACGTDFNRWDGTTLTTGAILGSVQPSRYFVEWIGNLYNLDNTGQMDFSTDEGVTWVTDAKSDFPSGHYTSLFKYHSSTFSNQVVIYLGTKEGLKEHNNEATEFFDTPLPLPFHDNACRGSVWWRDSAFISSGMAVYQYHVSGNGATVLPMGLDQDDGVPEKYAGHITKLLAGHNYLYAFVDATSETARDLFGGDGNGGFFDATITADTGFSVVFRYDGLGWTVVAISASSDTPILAGTLATADDQSALWFGMNSTLQFVELPVSLENPTEVSTSKFAASSKSTYGWFDDNEATAKKLGVDMTGFWTKMSEDEYSMLYYALDYDDDNFTLFTNTDFPDGKITSNGQHTFTFADGAGLEFTAIRFEEDLVRGSTNTKAPDRRWLRLSFIPTLQVKWAFQVRVDCRRNYRRRKKQVMVDALKAAMETGTMGKFKYQHGSASTEYRVKILDMPGAEFGGKKHEGIFDVMLIAPN